MGKSSNWRPNGSQWKNKKRNQQQGGGDDNDATPRPENNTGEEQQQQNNNNTAATPKAAPAFPSHCRGLVHVALCVAYSGIAFRGLQLQPPEHLSHTVEGTLLIALKRAGYLLEEDFTPDGTRLRFEGGIRIGDEVTTSGGNEGETAKGEAQIKAVFGENSAAVTAAASAEEVGDAEQPTAGTSNNNADAAVADATAASPSANDNENEDKAKKPYYPPHVHKTIVPPHLQHLSKRQRKKYDPNYNPDGKFQFGRACRTDKGVHAIRNIVSLYLREKDWRRDGNEGMVARINEFIPVIDEEGNNDEQTTTSSPSHRRPRKVMQILAVTPVLPSFNPKECCNSRVYRYLIPLYALGFPMVPTPTSGMTSGVNNTSTASGDEQEQQQHNPAYYNGSAIDDWERLFATYPELLAKGCELAEERRRRGSGGAPSSGNNTVPSDYAVTWLPKAHEVMRGNSAIVAEAAEREEEAVRTSEGNTSSASSPSSSSYDHPILRQLISYANELLHTSYVGPSRRFHNFSATAIDGEAHGHKYAAGAKYIKGDDTEASRSIRRCELSPCVVWLRAPGNDEEAATNYGVTKGDICANVASGTMALVTNGDYGSTTPSSSSSVVDGTNPVTEFYQSRVGLWKAREAKIMATVAPKGNGNSHKSASQPPLLPFVVFQVDGQSFLLNMIRKMVGYMVAILRGGRPWWVPRMVGVGGDVTSASNTNGTCNEEEHHQLLAQRATFMGYCKPIVLTEPFIMTSMVQVPMAPGPYLSLMQSKYTTYDMTVRGMNRRSRAKALREAKAAAAVAAQMGEEAAEGKDEEATKNKDVTASTTAPAYRPYYQTDVHPIGEAWSSPNTSGITPSSIIAAVGSKRPRDDDATDGDLNTEAIPTAITTASPLPPQQRSIDVEASAESFYWNVVATDIAAWDCNVYLTDADVMLGFRDGKRAVREERAAERGWKVACVEVAKTDEAVTAVDQTAATAAGPTDVAVTAPSSATPEAMLELLSHPPFITPAAAANPKFLARLRRQVTTPSQVGEMTAFLRSLRVHNWHIKTDDKMVARLQQKHEEQLRAFEARQLQKQQQQQLLEEQQQKQLLVKNGDNDAEGALPLANAGNEAMDVVADNEGQQSATATATPQPPRQQQQPPPAFIARADLRKQRLLERCATDTNVIKQMVAARGVLLHVGGGCDEDQTASLTSGDVPEDGENDDDDDDAALLQAAATEDDTANNKKGGGGGGRSNNNNNQRKKGANTNNEGGDNDDDSFGADANYVAYEMHVDDGWLYSGPTPATRAHHRYVYKLAMAAVVKDRAAERAAAAAAE